MSGLSKEICPKCQAAYLTLPKMATGHYQENNRGRFYQKASSIFHNSCARHDFTPESSCDYFYFNDTVQRQFEGSDSSPESSSLLHFSSSPASRSSPVTPQASGTRQPPHHNGPDRVVLNSFTVSGQPLSSPTTSVPSGSSPSVISVVPTKAYARPVDPSYATKVGTGTFEINSASNQAAAYKKARAHTIEAHWWAKDHEPAEVFSVHAPHFPLFHPQHCSPMINFVGEANTRNYAYWSDTRWMRTDGPVPVKIGTPLYLKSCDVTVCVDGPVVATTKRKLSLSFETPETPSSQRIRKETSPKFKASNRLVMLEPLVLPVAHPPPLVQGANVIDLTLSDAEDDVFGNSENTRRPLNLKVEASDFTLQSASTNASATASATASSSKKPWPFLYANDMDDGFRLMRAQGSGNMTGKFEDAFPGTKKFTSSTFYDNLNKWKALSREERREAVALGKSKRREGEWLYVLSKAKQRSTKK
ncbi:hypothetical protein DFH09DRAFT_1118950 [Mycena vulgaris]|nr:hypothetical protein DFH09DRAFT_1118950 [Mycena vulgaris]